jgi:hypothetical protein
MSQVVDLIYDQTHPIQIRNEAGKCDQAAFSSPKGEAVGYQPAGKQMCPGSHV